VLILEATFRLQSPEKAPGYDRKKMKYFLNSEVLPFFVALIFCVSATDMTEKTQNMLSLA
jgi:hypothetical protein